MPEELVLPSTKDRAEMYDAVLPQLEALLSGEDDVIAAMANICAVLNTAFGWHWTGFYRVVGDQLVLGPFQGPVACARIAHGKGVCGTAWAQHRTVIVADVEEFPGHIACSALSKSEIVVPVLDRDHVVRAVLDVDSVLPADFTTLDAEGLERVCALLSSLFA